MQPPEFFDHRPRVKRRANPLPENPEGEALKRGRFPSWLHRRLSVGNGLSETARSLGERGLATVCEEARCPNRSECWSKKTATFLVMGDLCTRSCGFCSIGFSKRPPPLDKEEPQKVAASVLELGLSHVVITMVARDDLDDGGASHLAAIVRAVRQAKRGVTIELLTSDFEGRRASLDLALAPRPEIFNYNLETVRSMTPRVRHKATYERTLELIAYAKESRLSLWVKSGLMVGLGEKKEEVFQALADLSSAGCDIATVGQYLQSDRRKLLVKRFVRPEEFKEYEAYGLAAGLKQVYAGPFVRSSYNAASLLNKMRSSDRV